MADRLEFQFEHMVGILRAAGGTIVYDEADMFMDKPGFKIELDESIDPETGRRRFKLKLMEPLP